MSEGDGYRSQSVTRSAWEERQRQWARYHAWEESCPEAQPEWDPAARVRWYGQAWDLARRFKPEWASEAEAIDWDKIRRIAKWREAVARLGGPGFA